MTMFNIVLKLSDTKESKARFPSSPEIIRVPFFLLFGFIKGASKEKGQKGTTTEEPKNSTKESRGGHPLHSARDLARPGMTAHQTAGC